MTRPAFLKQFRHVTGPDGQWRAECPLCGGDRSLSIGESTKRQDTYVINCFAGCAPRDVLAVAELTFENLLYQSTHATGSEYIYTGTHVNRRSVDSPADRMPEVEQLLKLDAAGKLGDVPQFVLPQLPPDATEPMRRVARFFSRVHALRQWAGMEPEVIVSSHWAADKLRLPQPTVWRALQALVNAGVLIDAGRRPGRGDRRGPRLYLPGVGSADVCAGPLPARAHSIEPDGPGCIDQRQEVGDGRAAGRGLTDGDSSGVLLHANDSAAPRGGGVEAAGERFEHVQHDQIVAPATEVMA